MTDTLLNVVDLRKYFPVRNAFGWRTGWLKALDGVSFALCEGEVLGLVGESGCGKSTLGKTLIGVNRAMAGTVSFQGREIASLSPRQRRAAGKDIQYVYQDPGASLDPRWKIGSSLHEPLIIHEDLDSKAREARVLEVMEAVGLPKTHLDLYPHELSGGQQRRVGLARILTLKPKLIILDEPTSGLDVSVQAMVLKLLLELQERYDLSYLFISHDLNVVNIVCQRVAIMYLGKIVEIGTKEEIFEHPRHPYSQLLLSAIPKIGGERFTREVSLAGEPPNPMDLPIGCRFQGRCPKADALCARTEPSLQQHGERQRVACHHV